MSAMRYLVPKRYKLFCWILFHAAVIFIFLHFVIFTFGAYTRYWHGSIQEEAHVNHAVTSVGNVWTSHASRTNVTSFTPPKQHDITASTKVIRLEPKKQNIGSVTTATLTRKSIDAGLATNKTFTSPERPEKWLTNTVTLALQRPNIEGIDIPPWSGHLDLRIICIVFNRGFSLSRLLKSLNTVDYLGEKVLLEVFIDRSKKDNSIHTNTYIAASKFKFKHGDYRVHNHTRHVGIYGQWMATWKPAPNSKEIALILEDDVTVSPQIYRWLKNVHKKYDYRADIAGYSLQGRSIKHNYASAGFLIAPFRQICMLYPIVGTWGFSPNRKNWFEFIDWYKEKSKDRSFYPLVDGILPTQWYKGFMKEGTTDSMWSMWHIYYTYINKQYVLYPSILPYLLGFASHWGEEGLHYKKVETRTVVDPLVPYWHPVLDLLPDRPFKLNYGGVPVGY